MKKVFVTSISRINSSDILYSIGSSAKESEKRAIAIYEKAGYKAEDLFEIITTKVKEKSYDCLLYTSPSPRD